ncbi:MAG: DUF11 domain-containing protein, partial [Chloroflexi bacterium]|nr:DUF11 domain-containing protein [Chloroflexota bacterium]
GEDQTYGITVCNTGSDTLTALTVRDTLDSRLTFVMADPDTGSSVGDSIYVWDIGLMTPGQCVEIQLSVLMDSTATDSILINAATTQGTDESGDPISDVDSTEVIVHEPPSDLDIEKMFLGNGIPAGGEGSYLIMVSNAGEQVLTDVTVRDSLPNGLVFLSADPDTSSSVGDSVYVWSIPILSVGHSQGIVMNVWADAGLTPGSLLDNIAIVGGTDEQGDTLTVVNGGGDADTTSTLVIGFGNGIQVNLIATDNEFTPGENHVYSVTVCNTGSDTLNTVTVRDTLDNRLSFVSGVPDTSSSVGDSVYVWTFYDMLPGYCEEIQLTVHVDPTTTDSTIFNSVTVVGTTDEGATVTDADTTIVLVYELRDDIDIETIATETPFISGDTETFSITVTNSGADTLTGIVVRDTLDFGLIYYDSANPAYPAPFSVEGDSVIVWNLTELAPGTSHEIQLSVVVRDSVGGPTTLTHTVHVTSTDSQGDSHSDSDTTQV